MKPLPRILSIQSHVVHGHVGNRSVTFPLQLNGFEIDNINTVQKCTHNRYASFTGTVLDTKDFLNIVDGLRQNGLLYKYSYIMTGYIFSSELLKLVAEIVEEIKENAWKLYGRNVIYLCDPVMGDIYPEISATHTRGKMYVPEDLLPVYRDQILPLADILTPNQCELELLLKTQNDGNGVLISSDKDMKNALNQSILDDKQIFVTSDLQMTSPVIKGYCKLGNTEKSKIFYFESDRVPSTFVGTGDLFSATLLAELHSKLQKVNKNSTKDNAEMISDSEEENRSRSNSDAFVEIDFVENIKNILWTMYHVVSLTYEYSNKVEDGSSSDYNKFDKIELQLVRCKKEIDMETRTRGKDFVVQEI